MAPAFSVHEHRKHVAGLLALTPIEQRPVMECLGLALADDLGTVIPLPPFDNAAMDGYAVHAEDVSTPDGKVSSTQPVALPVVADIWAGRTDVLALPAGTAARIMTGAQIPPGADSIVPVEHTRPADSGRAGQYVTVSEEGETGQENRVLVEHAPKLGAHIRRAGEDVHSGQTVLERGATLGAAQLGLAHSVGATNLSVHRPLRVLVLSTGTELVQPPQRLRPGQIYDSNGGMLAAAVTEAGAHAEQLRFVADDVGDFHRALQPHLPGTDLILTTGGVSAGAYEVVRDALSQQGVEFRTVAMQPGKPQGAGFYRSRGDSGGIPVLALPGNPVSALVSFEVFVRPALRAAAGHTRTQRPRLHVELTEELSSPAGKRQFQRGILSPDTRTARPYRGRGSHLLAALAASDCLLDIPEEATHLPAGSTVDAWMLNPSS